jgi:hypothetical protein
MTRASSPRAQGRNEDVRFRSRARRAHAKNRSRYMAKCRRQLGRESQRRERLSRDCRARGLHPRGLRPRPRRERPNGSRLEGPNPIKRPSPWNSWAGRSTRLCCSNLPRPMSQAPSTAGRRRDLVRSPASLAGLEILWLRHRHLRVRGDAIIVQILAHAFSTHGSIFRR